MAPVVNQDQEPEDQGNSLSKEEDKEDSPPSFHEQDDEQVDSDMKDE